MSKSFKWSKDEEQQSRQDNKAKKLSQQQQGRIEKAALRSYQGKGE